MKCLNCGYERDGDFTFCPSCGTKAAETAYATPNVNAGPTVAPAPASTFKAPAFLKDNLFLTVCILTTVGAAAALFSGNLSVISVLSSIFLWLIYSTAREDNPAFLKHMRSISGTIFANYVINWVLCGLCAFCGLIVTTTFSLGSRAFLYGDIFSELVDALYDSMGSEWTEEFLEIFSSVTAFGIATILSIVGVILLLVAVAIALFNVFGTRSIHKFAQSLYLFGMNQTNTLVKFEAAKNWMLVFGIFNGLSALSSLSNAENSLLSFLGGGCIAAAYIVSYVLLKKYFTRKPETYHGL